MNRSCQIGPFRLLAVVQGVAERVRVYAQAHTKLEETLPTSKMIHA